MNTLPQRASESAPLISMVNRNFLESLAKSIQISDSLYQAAEDRYTSVAKWFKRDASTLKYYDPDLYPQGSFALGTVIKPVSEEDDYDIDMICAFTIDVGAITQEDFKKKFSMN